MKSWWERPSVWSKQGGQIIYSREMDWVLLAAHENKESMTIASGIIGVSYGGAMNRVAKLVYERAQPHWRQRPYGT